MVEINPWVGIFAIILGVLILIFKRSTARFLIAMRNILKKSIMKSRLSKFPFVFVRDYEEDPTINWAMTLLGIAFILFGLIMIFFPWIFS